MDWWLSAVVVLTVLVPILVGLIAWRLTERSWWTLRGGLQFQYCLHVYWLAALDT